MSRREKLLEVLQGAVAGMYGVVVGDIVAVVPERGRKERHQPDGVDTQFLQIIHLLIKSLEVPDAIPAAVEESPDVDLIDDRAFIPILARRLNIYRHRERGKRRDFGRSSRILMGFWPAADEPVAEPRLGWRNS